MNPIVHAELYEDNLLFDTGIANRWETVARTLPSADARSSTLIIDGELHFKSPPSISCPHCGETLHRGTTTLFFKHAPSATREQAVEGWICDCGEAYVPGDVARDAYYRAMAGSDELPSPERQHGTKVAARSIDRIPRSRFLRALKSWIVRLGNFMRIVTRR